MDFENYLKQELYNIAVQELELDNKIEVVDYRSFKMPEDKTTFLFVIRYLTGGYVGSVKTQPVQIFVYSELNDIENAFLILDIFSKTHNNMQFILDDEFIKMNFDSPVSMRNFIQSENGYRASVYAFGTYIINENVSDIKNIEIDGLDINYINASLAYAAVLNTTKLSGVQLSTSMKQEAGLTLTITLMKENNAFCNNIENIMYGAYSGNRTFSVKLIKNDDTSKTLDFKIDSITYPTSKLAAPVITVVMRH